MHKKCSRLKHRQWFMRTLNAKFSPWLYEGRELRDSNSIALERLVRLNFASDNF